MFNNSFPQQSLLRHEGEPFIFSANGRFALKQKNPLQLWSTETVELLAAFKGVTAYAGFSQMDKQLLVTRGKDKKTALLWDISIQ